MRIPLSTDLKTRTGAPNEKDARQKNSYIEIKGEDAIVRKRPSAQGGVSVGTGTAQGGYGLVLFWSDVAYPITFSTLTTCNNATNYVQGDHVTVEAVDYWATTSTVNTCPAGGAYGGDWSTTYVPPTAKTYATWDPDNLGTYVTLSGSDLIADIYLTSATGISYNTRSNIGKSSGKWYWEYTLTTCDDIYASGVAFNSAVIPSSASTNAIGGYPSAPYGKFNYLDVLTSGFTIGGSIYGARNLTNDVIGVALDMDNYELTYYRNGVTEGALSSLLPGTYYAMIGAGVLDHHVIVTANFGASAFTHSVPSGYNSGLYTT